MGLSDVMIFGPVIGEKIHAVILATQVATKFVCWSCHAWLLDFILQTLGVISVLVRCLARFGDLDSNCSSVSYLLHLGEQMPNHTSSWPCLPGASLQWLALRFCLRLLMQQRTVLPGLAKAPKFQGEENQMKCEFELRLEQPLLAACISQLLLNFLSPVIKWVRASV